MDRRRAEQSTYCWVASRPRQRESDEAALASSALEAPLRIGKASAVVEVEIHTVCKGSD
ncbi:MAG TPA: hypothetical protein VMG41_02400 [Gemmatimonadales bacterium]|nr:hypothetical protein [Gemmatimonadales bacterium]